MNVEEEESLEVRQRNEIQALQVGFKNKTNTIQHVFGLHYQLFYFFLPRPFSQVILLQ